RERALFGLELVFHRAAEVRQVAVLERVNDDRGLGRARQKGRGRRARLGLARGVRAEGHPADLDLRVLLGHAQERAAAADLDVVAVRAEREDLPGTAERRDALHAQRGAWSCFHTSQGTWPRV